MAGRILGIDYGSKRVGFAVSDPGQMIANGLKTIPAHEVWTFLEEYMRKENIAGIVVGYPKRMNNLPSEAMEYITPFVRTLKKRYPEIAVDYMDERFTSKLAVQSMVDAGLKKKTRRDKALVDKISATLILQSYLDVISKNMNK